MFKCLPPHKSSTRLTEAVDRALNAFARLSNGYPHLPMSLALMEDNSVCDILQSGIETAKFFFHTLSDFAASFLNRVLRGETLSLSMREKAEVKAYNRQFPTKEAFLEFRAGFGMPLVSFIGYNFTPCMERPERLNQYAENVANPTLSPMLLELRNLYLRYGLTCSRKQDHVSILVITEYRALAARNEDQKKEIEQDYRHKHAAYMIEVVRLLKKGCQYFSTSSEYQLRLVDNNQFGQLPITTKTNGKHIKGKKLELLEERQIDKIKANKAMNDIRLQAANVSNDRDPDSKFETVFHRRKWQVRLAERLLHCCSSKEADRRFTILRDQQKVSSCIVTQNSDYRELIEGDLPISVQGKTVAVRPKNEEEITVPVSPQTRKHLEQNKGKKEFYFNKLVFGSSCPLWDGTSFSAEVSAPLKGVGMSLYSTTLNTWVPISANFRFREVVSRFTVFAGQAAIIARQSRTFDNDHKAPNHTSEAKSDDEEDVPECQISKRTLPLKG
ncbi:uncharacterized protein FA14DRAFT_158861 [Meira miltonrushii]|uniref:Uncharacterized protein n=1 Tax=Meira miltonrushii TaxID=1280837 RepID=A0A316V184_9BASI|nr:uncharacterized protein FA14DRAFT_158861 [Meira miltonrushii]PWN31317.1 hypothetical protein FA14DRAFT_158861 [Meira miltonrushii]